MPRILLGLFFFFGLLLAVPLSAKLAYCQIVALEPTTSEDDTGTRELLSCAIPEAKTVPYSPFDGGESAGKIIAKCWIEALRFVDDCIKTKSHEDGHDKETCQLSAAMKVQAAIKQFGR